MISREQAEVYLEHGEYSERQLAQTIIELYDVLEETRKGLVVVIAEAEDER